MMILHERHELLIGMSPIDKKFSWRESARKWGIWFVIHKPIQCGLVLRLRFLGIVCDSISDDLCKIKPRDILSGDGRKDIIWSKVNGGKRLNPLEATPPQFAFRFFLIAFTGCKCKRMGLVLCRPCA